MTNAESLRAWIAGVRSNLPYPTVDEVVMIVEPEPSWPLDRLAELPQVFRVVVAITDFRAQYLRNGLDGFVWNRRAIVQPLMEAFDHIGAKNTAALMGDIFAEMMRQEEEETNPDPVQEFVAVRDAAGPAFGPWQSFDPLDEIEEALLDYLDRHAEAVMEQRDHLSKLAGAP